MDCEKMLSPETRGLDNLDNIATAIGKRRGTVKLDMVDAVIEVSAVEGDAPDAYCLAVMTPFRGIQFGKSLTEGQVIAELRKAQRQYLKMYNKIARDIAWITGEESEEL